MRIVSNSNDVQEMNIIIKNEVVQEWDPKFEAPGPGGGLFKGGASQEPTVCTKRYETRDGPEDTMVRTFSDETRSAAPSRAVLAAAWDMPARIERSIGGDRTVEANPWVQGALVPAGCDALQR